MKEEGKDSHGLLFNSIMGLIFIITFTGVFFWMTSLESLRNPNPDNLRYALSASAQAFAAILVLGLIAIYNHMQFIDKLVKEKETRILTYMNQVIEWSYPDWDDRIETHVKANFDNAGFSRSYLVNQIRDYIKPYLYPKKTLDEDKLEKTILEAIDEFVDKKGEIATRESSIRLSNELRKFRKEDELDDIKIESIIKKQIDEVGKQKTYINSAIGRRKRYKDEFASLFKSMIVTVFALVCVVSLSLIGVLLIDSGADFPRWVNDLGGVPTGFIILMGIIFTFILVTLMSGSFLRIKGLLQE